MKTVCGPLAPPVQPTLQHMTLPIAESSPPFGGTVLTRVVHTADWHLGHRLMDQDRVEEHRAFLAWLIGALREEKAGLLLIAGDVFDSANPPREAEALYFNFLKDAAALGCDVVVIAGNHDSAQHLSAPALLLKNLNIHVIGSLPFEAQEQALLFLKNVAICAVPFLRERDLRQSRSGEDQQEIQRELKDQIALRYTGMRTHFETFGKRVPLIATGHLTALGGASSESEREIGNLGAISPECFKNFSYTALGHLHRAQIVGGNEMIRYSGSPIPLSFSEAEDRKQVVVLECGEQSVMRARAREIPQARRLLRLRGSLAELQAALKALEPPPGLPPWIEVTVLGEKSSEDLDVILQEAIAPGRGEILKVVAALSEGAGPGDQGGEALEDLQPRALFEARLQAEGIDPESAGGIVLLETFQELCREWDAQKHN